MRERKRTREGLDHVSDDNNSDLENGDILDSEEEDFQERKLLGEVNPSQIYKSTHKQEEDYKIKFNTSAPKHIQVVKGDKP
jgi:hypothetical protein